MKLSVLVLSCAIVYTSADLPRTSFPPQSSGPVPPRNPRFRRQAPEIDIQLEEPERGSITFVGEQPLNGQPTWNLNGNANIFRYDHITADVSAGVNKVPGQPAQPHLGIEAEKKFGNNGVIKGHVQFQPNLGSSELSPSVDITGGVEFKKEAKFPGTSITFQGSQPLSSVRQPTLDLNVNHNIIKNDRTTADVFGGVSKVPGQSAQPHIGIQAERNLGNNGYIKGHTKFEPIPGSLSPSISITGDLQFKKKAEPQGTSITFQGSRPLSGPMRQPTWDLNVNHNMVSNDRTTADVFGGVKKVPGQSAQPHIGLQAERNFGTNCFIKGRAQFQPNLGNSRHFPSVVTGDVEFRKQLKSRKTSIALQMSKADDLMHQSTLDLNVNHNIIKNGRTTADICGGLNKVLGEPAQPYFGIEAEKSFCNGFIKCKAQFEPILGKFSPSVRITGGFRLRREAESRGTSITLPGSQPLNDSPTHLGSQYQSQYPQQWPYNHGRLRRSGKGELEQPAQPHFGIQT